jgi:hypothetical protein
MHLKSRLSVVHAVGWLCCGFDKVSLHVVVGPMHNSILLVSLVIFIRAIMPYEPVCEGFVKGNCCCCLLGVSVTGMLPHKSRSVHVCLGCNCFPMHAVQCRLLVFPAWQASCALQQLLICHMRTLVLRRCPISCAPPKFEVFGLLLPPCSCSFGCAKGYCCRLVAQYMRVFYYQNCYWCVKAAAYAQSLCSKSL